MEEQPNNKGNMPQRIAERIVLLRDYLNAHANRTHAVSVQKMKQYLNDLGDNCGIKPIYRALNILIADFGMKLEYSEKCKGWVLENPPFEQYELRLIIDSIQASKFITQERATQLSNKIRKLAGADGKETLNRQTFVYERIKSMNNSVVKDADRIYQAIQDDKKISFKYYHRTPNTNSPRQYSNKGNPIIVSPYALIWSGGNLYLYAYNGKKFVHYRVDRMEKISNPLILPRDGAAEYSEKNITARKTKVFNMYEGNKAYKTTIQFQNSAADTVIDEFGEINMMYMDASHFAITAPISLSPTFYAWVATLGHKAKILSPKEAVDGMREFLKDAMDMCKEAPEK